MSARASIAASGAACASASASSVAVAAVGVAARARATASSAAIRLPPGRFDGMHRLDVDEPQRRVDAGPRRRRRQQDGERHARLSSTVSIRCGVGDRKSDSEASASSPAAITRAATNCSPDEGGAHRCPLPAERVARAPASARLPA